jgi:hypothetical protein
MPLDGTTSHVEEIGRQMIAIGRRISPAGACLLLFSEGTRGCVLTLLCRDVGAR